MNNFRKSVYLALAGTALGLPAATPAIARVGELHD